MDQNINFNVNASTSQAVEAMNKVTTSVINVTDAASKMNKQIFTLANGTMGYKDASGMFIKTTNEQTNALERLNETSRRGAMVGLSFNRIIQDAGYFGQSMAMGFMAVGNNITYFAEQLSFARQQGLSMTGVLKGMLTGVNAWMFGINLAVSAITFFTMQTRKAKEEAETFSLKSLIGELNAYESSLKGIKKEISALSTSELTTALGKTSQEIVNVNESLRKNLVLRTLLSRSGLGFVSDWVFGDMEDLGKKKKQIQDVINLFLGEVEQRSSGLRSPNWLRSEIERLTDAFDKGDKSLSPKIKKLKAELKGWTDLLDDPRSTKKDFVSSWDIALDKLDAKIEDFKQKLANVKEYFNAVLFADPKAMKYFEEQIDIQAKKLGLTAIQTERYVIAERKKLWAEFVKWRAENDPMWAEKSGVGKKFDKPDLLAYDKEDKKSIALYKQTLREFSSLGSNLRQIFKDSGDTFLNSMIEALNVVTAIAEVIQSIATIKTLLTTLGWLSGTPGAGMAIGDMVGGVPIGGGMRSMANNNPTIGQPIQMMIPVYIGEENIQTIIIDTTKKAKRLRYLN